MRGQRAIFSSFFSCKIAKGAWSWPRDVTLPHTEICLTLASTNRGCFLRTRFARGQSSLSLAAACSESLTAPSLLPAPNRLAVFDHVIAHSTHSVIHVITARPAYNATVWQRETGGILGARQTGRQAGRQAGRRCPSAIVKTRKMENKKSRV